MTAFLARVNPIARRRARLAAERQAARERARRDREHRIAWLEYKLELPGAENPGAPRIPTHKTRKV